MEKQIGQLLPNLEIQDSTYEEYEGVELTPEETAAALNRAKMLKHRDMTERQKVEARRIAIRKYCEPWSAEELKADVLARAKTLPFDFLVDKDNERVIDLLSLYFTGDPEFQFGTGYSLNKGVVLVSPEKGTGKSILMSLFARNKREPYLPIPTTTIAGAYHKTGESVIDAYSTVLRVGSSKLNFFRESVGICFEDLGMEQDKNSYGNRSNVMADVLFRLYTNGQQLGNWSPFHATTNYTGDELEARYGDRIRSRLREMFNFIYLPGNDRRR